MPRLIALHTDPNYLHRQTPLFGISALSQIVTTDTIRRQFIPVLQTLSQDRVANIRMNVAKAIASLWPVVSTQAQANQDIIVSQADVANSMLTLVLFM